MGKAKTCKLPSTHLTRKDVKFNWISQCEESFEEVKYALTHASILFLPNFSERFERAILLQNVRPIAFESRKLSSAKRNYTTCEQELTAIVHAMQLGDVI
jgi:hypothetical protein